MSKMTNEEALIVLEIQLTNIHGEYASIEMPPIIKELYDAFEIAVDALQKQILQQDVLNILDGIITQALDNSDNQIEPMALRWVLDEISKLEVE